MSHEPRMKRYSVGVWYPRNVEIEARNIKEAMEKVLNGEGEFITDDCYSESKLMGKQAVTEIKEEAKNE